MSNAELYLRGTQLYWWRFVASFLLFDYCLVTFVTKLTTQAGDVTALEETEHTGYKNC